MKINYDILPESMKADIDEILLSIRLTRLISVQARAITEKEKTFINDILSSIEKCINERNEIKNRNDFTEQLKIADNIYTRLKQHKTIKLDLTKYENFYDNHITSWLRLWEIGELFEQLTGMKEKSERESYEEYKTLMTDNLLPMLLFQLLGSIVYWIKEKYSVKHR